MAQDQDEPAGSPEGGMPEPGEFLGDFPREFVFEPSALREITNELVRYARREGNGGELSLNEFMLYLQSRDATRGQSGQLYDQLCDAQIHAKQAGEYEKHIGFGIGDTDSSIHNLREQLRFAHTITGDVMTAIWPELQERGVAFAEDLRAVSLTERLEHSADLPRVRPPSGNGPRTL